MRLEISELREAGGRVLCRCDVTLDGCVTLIDVSLWQDGEGHVRLGLPQRAYQSEGRTKYTDTVKVTDAAERGLRRRIHEKYLSSPLCGQPEDEGCPNDPFADA